ncbi:MAG TPA: glycogen synthase GlgA [Clostridiaceae bacterium]|nr:glycogen synthase GlgA [Clostridiaceae bacterium]
MTKTKVLFVASEVAPFAKVGGLADVVGVLPGALNNLDCDARVVMPLYRQIKQQYGDQLYFMCWTMLKLGWRSMYSGLFSLEKDGVTFYFIDNEYYFGHDAIYQDYSFDIERFCFFQRAVLEAMGDPMEFEPDIVHCNDWQAGMIPVLLDAHYRPHGYHKDVKTVLTIHNLKYQGIHGVERIADLCDLSPQYMTAYGVLKDGVPNFLKAGIVYSDAVTTVSPTYAQEILSGYYGEGLDGVLRNYAYKLTGILNGIDLVSYNPETDEKITKNYTVDTYKEGKAECKQALQARLNLDINPGAPLLGMITRLVDQKGIDLLTRVLDEMLYSGMQVVVLGTGDPYYEDSLRRMSDHRPNQLSINICYNDELARQIYSGCDMFLMPSLFEPCGLSQMIAMRYGTVPIVRETGGLKDTVTPYNQFTGEGNGFSFSNINAHELLFTSKYACDIYRHHEDAWDDLVKAGMEGDYSWNSSAKKYADLYHSLLAAD